MAKVKVRVAVAVDHTGDWNAYGSNGGKDTTMMQIAVETVADGEARYFLGAELDIPEEKTIQATVEKA